MKLITDTCSVMKLLAFGTCFFDDGFLPTGRLVIHPRVFREVRAWPKYTKQKYPEEIKLLKKIGNRNANISVPRNDAESHSFVIRATADAYNLSVGSGDIEQLVSAIHHECMLVTDDGHFGKLAKRLDVTCFDADDIVKIARDNGSITLDDIEGVKQRWRTNNEKMTGKV